MRERRYDDPHLLVLEDKVLHGDARDVTIGNNGVLRMQGRIFVPHVDGLRELILEEAHSSRYSIHLGAAKMYQDLRQYYWWRWMKKDIVGIVAQFLTRYHGDPSHVLDFSSVQLDKDLSYVKEPVTILDRQVRKLRSKNIASVKVQ
ncbi:uncharacterized protein [Nicotiana sylvestris]|uniref:uncharacterized protein n=1 Tax=Nicotiana sylvestris TaxID=4096 RepID=UPI00388CD7F7